MCWLAGEGGRHSIRQQCSAQQILQHVPCSQLAPTAAQLTSLAPDRTLCQLTPVFGFPAACALLCSAVPYPKPCPFGSTSPAGSMELAQCVSVAQECPVGQMAPADAVSREQCSCYPGFGGGGSPDAPCTICPAGTYARGGDLEACTVSRMNDTGTVRCPKRRVELTKKRLNPGLSYTPAASFSKGPCVC